jgi:predicted  nucleic acid-binding Zn-ribbon protein
VGGDYQIGLDVLIGASSGVLGAIGAYVKLRSTLDLVAAENVNQEKEIHDLRERKKEMNTALHKRIDDLRGEFTDLQKEVHQGQQKLETHMAQMELRIVKEIQKMAEKLTNK